MTPDTDHVATIKAKDAAGNTSKASTALTVHTPPGTPGGTRTFRNDTDFPIRDHTATTSPIRTTAPGQAATTPTIAITATHTCTQELNITPVGPSGRTYPLQRYRNYPCTPFPDTERFTAAAVAEQATGTWTLSVGVNGPGDTGTPDTWSITL